MQMNFGLLQPIDYFGNAMNAFQHGQQQGRQIATDKALAALSGNPDDPKALQRYREVDPRGAMAFEQHRQTQMQQQLEQHRDSILIGAKIFRQMQVKDQASYEAALQMARSIGADISQAPPQFDPQYVQGVVQTADALDPQSAQQGFTLGEGQVRYDQNGNVIAQGPAQRPRYYPVQPGGKLVLDPSMGGPAPGSDDEWEIVGGPTPQASGPFPSAGN